MTEAPALGDPTLDADHAKLADLVDRLAAAKGADVLASLDALQAHASEHFALEDQELRQMRDGNASCHLDEHAAVLKSMDEVRGIVAAGPDSTESAHLVARLTAELMALDPKQHAKMRPYPPLNTLHVTAELRRWLPEHVTAMDAGVAHTRTRSRLGGAPVVLTRRSSPPG